MFYENFKKKLGKYKLKEKSKYKYGINFRKKALWVIFSSSIMVFSLYSFYIYSLKNARFYIIIGTVLFLVAATFIKNLLSYKLEVDKENGKIVLKKNEIKIDEIEKATLKFITPPGQKYPEKCIDIVTKERVRIVVPLIMANSIEFTKVMETILQDRFSIE
jgi:hypothetical protein